jgi:hypothetical protein
MKAQPNKTKEKKRTAKIVCPNGKNFWTTQKQFWQWIRAGIIRQTGDRPLKGIIIRESELKLIMRNHTILNLSAPNHLAEVIRAIAKSRKKREITLAAEIVFFNTDAH